MRRQRVASRPGGQEARPGGQADDVVLSVRDLRTHFHTRQGVGRAVDGVSFDLRRGETLGLVGESGCGKSLTALSIVGLHPQPAAEIVGGRIEFEGTDLTALPADGLRRLRGERIAMLFQDPQTALNPVLRIGDQVGEPLRWHRRMRGAALRERTVELLRMLGIPAPRQRLANYPHQLSGGMRQRVVGAIALSCEPSLLIADEPTTALDVTIQAAVLARLKQIQRETGLAILFINHDFSVVARMCDRVAVMYAGKIVEEAPVAKLFEAPRHPYTEALIASVPELAGSGGRLHAIEGQPPSIYARPPGCPFAPRCGVVQDECVTVFPDERLVGEGHRVSCWSRR